VTQYQNIGKNMTKVIFENLVDKSGKQLELKVKDKKALKSGKRLKKIFESKTKE